MNVKESIQQQFGSVAAHYATSAVHAGGPDLQAMLDAAPLTGAERVLDVGCGTGHTALAFAPRAAEVVAVDLTAEMLEQGRRLAAERGIANVIFQRGDVEQLAAPDASFDVVTSRYSAHHYPHPFDALREIGRVLRPGGVFLLVDVVAPDDATADTFMNAVELLRDRSHVRDHSTGQWAALLRTSGFAPAVVGTWPLRLQFDTWVARMHTPAPAVAQIKALFDGAPRDVRATLAVEDDYSFSVPVALIRARRDTTTR